MTFDPTPTVTKSLETIPEVDAIVEEAIEKLKNNGILTPKQIKSNFSDALSILESTAHNLYREYENKALEDLKESYIKAKGEYIPPKKVMNNTFPLVKEFEFRAGQSRKARGGSTFEKAVPLLLQSMLIQCEKPTKNDDAKTFRQIDLIIPSMNVAIERPEQAVFISVKRTLRERWKQVVDEKILGYIYLVTHADGKDLTKPKYEDISKHKIILYVRDEIKNLDYLKDAKYVRTLNDLPKDLERFVKNAG